MINWRIFPIRANFWTEPLYIFRAFMQKIIFVNMKIRTVFYNIIYLYEVYGSDMEHLSNMKFSIIKFPFATSVFFFWKHKLDLSFITFKTSLLPMYGISIVKPVLGNKGLCMNKITRDNRGKSAFASASRK